MKSLLIITMLELLWLGFISCEEKPLEKPINEEPIVDAPKDTNSDIVDVSPSESDLLISYTQPILFDSYDSYRSFTLIYKTQNFQGEDWESAFLFSFLFQDPYSQYLDFGNLKLNNLDVPKYQDATGGNVSYGIFKYYLKNGQSVNGYPAIPDGWRLSIIKDHTLQGENSAQLNDFSTTIHTIPTIRITNLVSGAQYTAAQDLPVTLDRVVDKVIVRVTPLSGPSEERFEVFGVNQVPSNTFVIPKAELSKLLANNPSGVTYIVSVSTGGHTGDFYVNSKDGQTNYCVPVWSSCESTCDIYITP